MRIPFSAPEGLILITASHLHHLLHLLIVNSINVNIPLCNTVILARLHHANHAIFPRFLYVAQLVRRHPASVANLVPCHCAIRMDECYYVTCYTLGGHSWIGIFSCTLMDPLYEDLAMEDTKASTTILWTWLPWNITFPAPALYIQLLCRLCSPLLLLRINKEDRYFSLSLSDKIYCDHCVQFYTCKHTLL